MKTVFKNASAMIDALRDTLTPQEAVEYRYYEILGNISRMLVEYRINNNLNQKQLSSLLDVSQSMVSKYESGDYNISIRALNELCGKLNIDLDIRMTSKTIDPIKSAFEAAIPFLNDTSSNSDTVEYDFDNPEFVAA